MNTSALLRAGSRNRAPGRWARICPLCSAGFVLLASFAFGACSSDDSAKGTGNDPIGNNLNGGDECETHGDCADASGSSSSPTSTSNDSDDSEDPSTTDDLCADAWIYDGMDLRVLSEATSGEGSVDCSEDPDRIRSIGPNPLGIPDHTITETMTGCFEAALTTGHGAYAVERVQGPEYRFGRAWAVTPESELYQLGQDPMEGIVYQHKCGSLDGYLEGSDHCSFSYSSREFLCFYGVPAGGPCDTDADCPSPSSLTCNLESRRCDPPCLSSECL